MKTRLADAIRTLERLAGGRFDVWALCGPTGRRARQALMESLTGERLPAAKCGVNALQAEFYGQVAAEMGKTIRELGDCSRARQVAFADFCRLAVVYA